MIKTDYKEIFTIGKSLLDKIDPEIYNLLSFWKSDKEKITVNTSGSTGDPKTINISKKQMIASAENTLKCFDINENSTFLNCLPVKYIGGKMMLIRAIISKAKIVLYKPLANPIKELDFEIDFIALTPLQLGYVLENINNFEKIKLAIIGGGLVSENLISKIQNVTTQCFQTYGMTETISHIAVRNLKNCSNKTPYKCLSDVKLGTNKKNQLIINSKNLNIENLVTNDKVKIISDKEFLFLNRIDSISSVAPFRIINIGNSKKIKLLDFVKTIENSLGKKALRNYMPMQQGDVFMTLANTKLLKKITGFVPKTNYKEGVRKFIEWYLDYYKK